MSIRVGIYGYGNLGRGVEGAILQNPDMTAVGVFTRRDPASVKTLTGVPVYSAEKAVEMAIEIDVMILCGGSATDLPEMTPALAAKFNVIDSFDNRFFGSAPERYTVLFGFFCNDFGNDFLVLHTTISFLCVVHNRGCEKCESNRHEKLDFLRVYHNGIQKAIL